MSKYIVIEADTADELEEKVNERLSEGYLPIGGVSVAVLADVDLRKGGSIYVNWWAQAMFYQSEEHLNMDAGLPKHVWVR